LKIVKASFQFFSTIFAHVNFVNFQMFWSEYWDTLGAKILDSEQRYYDGFLSYLAIS